MKKVFSIAIMVVMLLTIASSVVLATDKLDLNPGSITGANASGISKVKDVGKQILGIVQVVGSIVAVIMIAIIGLKYLMGSPEGKAEYKKTLIPYVVGAVLLFAASNIAGIVYDWSQDIAKDGPTGSQTDQK